MTPTGPATNPEPATDAYEFPTEANAVFTTLGSRMRFVGVFTLGIGLVAVLVGLARRDGQDAAAILAGVLYAIIGFWTARAGGQFRSVAWTRGHDLAHLMAALIALRKLYSLQYWICLIALLAALVLLGSSALY